jgi:CheY-like chemotaxis protein
VLLVEDNPGDILLIDRTLAREPFPVDVHVAVDGEQAIRMLAQQSVKPDLVILDLNIPKVSGLAFLTLVRRLDMPTVVFSSTNCPENIRHAFELGARDYVEKSNDLEAFERNVSLIVRMWAHPREHRRRLPRR